MSERGFRKDQRTLDWVESLTECHFWMYPHYNVNVAYESVSPLTLTASRWQAAGFRVAMCLSLAVPYKYWHTHTHTHKHKHTPLNKQHTINIAKSNIAEDLQLILAVQSPFHTKYL